MSMNSQMKRLTQSDWIIAVGGVVAFVALFLPWYSWSWSYGGVLGGAGSTSYNGFASGWGWLYFIALLVVAAMFLVRMFMSASMPTLPIQDWMIYVIAAVIMVVAALLYWVAGTGGISYNGPGASAGISWGLFVAIAAAIAIGVGGFMSKSAAPRTSPAGGVPPVGPPPMQ